MAKSSNSQHEKQQDRRIKKLESDLRQQKARIKKLESRANKDDKLVAKLKKRVTALERRKKLKSLFKV